MRFTPPGTEPLTTPRQRNFGWSALLVLGFALMVLPGAISDTTREGRTEPPTSRVVLAHAPDAPAHRWQVSEASFYGPGLYGNRTACGQTLTRSTQGVAHKSLPCGTLVRFEWHGRELVVPVIDRGPYTAGREWDLTAAACEYLGRCHTAPVAWTR